MAFQILLSEPEALVERDRSRQMRRRFQHNPLRMHGLCFVDELLKKRAPEATAAGRRTEIHLAQLDDLIIDRIETSAPDHDGIVIDENAEAAAATLIAGWNFGEISVDAARLDDESEF